MRCVCPLFLAREFEHRRKMISKSFHHQLKLSDRQPLVGEDHYHFYQYHHYHHHHHHHYHYHQLYHIVLKNLGPPESMREHVVAASKEMSKGNWRQCADFILAVKVRFVLTIAEHVLVF